MRVNRHRHSIAVTTTEACRHRLLSDDIALLLPCTLLSLQHNTCGAHNGPVQTMRYLHEELELQRQLMRI